MNILIVEDELNYADTLEMFVDELGYNITGVVGEGKQALGLFQKQKPDLVLMDINLEGDLTGIDLAREFQSTQPTPIIFITSFDDKETFQMAKETTPYAYLVKPFDPDTLERSMELAIERAYSNDERVFKGDSEVALAPSCFFVKVRNRLLKVKTDEILWAEVQDKYCLLKTENKSYILRQSLKELVEKLDPGVFVQTHRSYIVNACKIESIDTQLYILHINGEEIPLGRSYKGELFHRLQML